ncbi:MAG: hypothetical protein WA459_24615 [Stellaceae bacterium]
MAIMTIGLDTSKSWLQVHGVGESGQAVLRRKLARGNVLLFFAGMEPCVVGLEACGGAHFLGPRARQTGTRRSADASALCAGIREDQQT